MGLETRHTEKNILFSLLCAEDFKDINRIIAHLKATMEPEDVELVQKNVTELKGIKPD